MVCEYVFVCCVVVCHVVFFVVMLSCCAGVQYQSHYSRHFMYLGEKERQDREVFQRNMRSRMETFKSTRHKRHKKERSLKKVTNLIQ